MLDLNSPPAGLLFGTTGTARAFAPEARELVWAQSLGR